jgi:hypothetical protein
MLIEELIRLGRPLLEGDADPQEVLRLITGVEDERVKNFYRHVFVVELPPAGQGDPRALAMQEFGDVDADGDFHVDQQRAVGAPFVLPSGGNPLSPQGRYGLPVYPCYDPHLQAFRESTDGVLAFLNGRLGRTTGFAVSEEEAAQVARVLHEVMAQSDFRAAKKVLGVLILARWGPDSFYTIADGERADRIGKMKNGRPIVPNYARIIDAVWAAREQEGREAGTRPGPCSFTGGEGEVVSAYCKAWPWAFPTWTCPLPHGGDEKLLVEGIGLSLITYRALTLGACIFNKLARRVSSLVIPEIFSPTETRAGKDQAQRRKLSDLPTVQGSAFLLPVQDRILSDQDHRYEFARGIRGMLDARPDDPTWADRYMTTVTGFDVVLPPDLSHLDDYRLTLVYFSGDYSRGDVHLRAFIQDVIPSTLSQLRDLAQSEARTAMALLRVLMPGMSEKRQAYLARCYESVPYLLARAYGGAYLWQQLEALLHRRPLSSRRVTANAAHRMQSLVPQWPHSRWDMADEVGFFLYFLNFLSQVNAHTNLTNHTGDKAMPMRPWQQVIQALERGPLEAMKFDESIAELGFACGLLIRRFSWWYSGELGSDKDFLKDRVLTFGANLSPRDVSRGVRSIRDVAHKFDDLRRAVELGQLAYYATKEERRQHVGDYARRLGIVLAELDRQRNSLEKWRDEFMTGFWAGYSLQGYDRPRKAKEEEKQPIPQTQE